MKKIKVFCILAVFVLLLSSCTFANFEADTMLSPPQMNSDNQEIGNILTSVAGGGYRFVYPKNGGYQTAINSIDINNDENAEAVCFYSKNGETSVNLILLEEKNNKWSELGKVSSKATAVDKVAFCDLNNDDTKEIIIGWQYLTGEENAIEIYSFKKDGTLKSVYTGLYSNFITFEDCVTVITKNLTGKTASAALIGNRGGDVAIINTVALNNAVTAFTSISTGHTDTKTYTIFIDEQLENSSYTTELLTVSISGAMLLSNTELGIQTTRTRPYVCVDVSGDSIPDIPVEKPLPSYTRGETIENLSYVDWYSFNSTGVKYIKSAYTSTNEQFYFVIPDKWLPHITIERDAENDRSIMFYLTDSEPRRFMFTIRVFSQQEFTEAGELKGYQTIATANENVYAFRGKVTEAETDFEITLDEIKSYFNLITM